MVNLTPQEQLIWEKKQEFGSWYKLISSGVIKSDQWNLENGGLKLFWQDLSIEAITNLKELYGLYFKTLNQEKISSDLENEINELQKVRKTLAYYLRLKFKDNYKNIFTKNNYHVVFQLLIKKYYIDLHESDIKIKSKGPLTGQVSLDVFDKSYSIFIMPITHVWESLNLPYQNEEDYLVVAGLLEDDWDLLEQLFLGKQLKDQGFKTTIQS